MEVCGNQQIVCACVQQLHAAMHPAVGQMAFAQHCSAAESLMLAVDPTHDAETLDVCQLILSTAYMLAKSHLAA